jgi:Ca2+/Na+ antiporter
MKNYREDIKTIIEVLTFGLVYLSISTIDYPIFSYLFLVLWITYWVYNLYEKFRYRSTNTTYVLFQTQNDEYSKVTSIVLGLMILVLSIVAMIWASITILYPIIGVAIGLLVFLNGIFDLPKGRIEFQDDLIYVNSLDIKMDRRKLKEINIYKERILITNIYGEIKKITNLNISVDSAELIKRYIIDNKNNISLTIINNVY